MVWSNAMDFTGVNYLAVLIAALAAWIFGAAWYGGLSKPWIKAVRLDPATLKMTPMLYATSFVAELIMAFVLAALVAGLHGEAATLGNGVAAGLLVWFGFIATTTAVNQRYEGYGWDLTLIDWGHWLGVAVIMGAIIGWWW
jgi:hypothetical protein